jgi:hypothetical protein
MESERFLFVSLVYITIETLAGIFADVFSRSRLIEGLDIHQAHLTDQHFEVIADFIRRTTSLTEVIFRDLHTTISANSMRMLTEAILANPNVRSLIINGYQTDALMIANDAVPILEHFIRTTQHLRDINFNGCLMNSAQFAQICQSMHDNHSITRFCVAAQNIVSNDMQHVARLARNNDTIQYIDISGNDNLGDQCIPFISNIFRDNATIRILHLEDIGLTQDGVNEIVEEKQYMESDVEIHFNMYDLDPVVYESTIVRGSRKRREKLSLVQKMAKLSLTEKK